MKLTGIKETQGWHTGTNNRGYWLRWNCPNCKYKENSPIVVVSPVDYKKAECDKCGEYINIKD